MQSIKVPIRKKSGNLFIDPRNSIQIVSLSVSFPSVNLSHVAQLAGVVEYTDCFSPEG